MHRQGKQYQAWGNGGSQHVFATHLATSTARMTASFLILRWFLRRGGRGGQGESECLWLVASGGKKRRGGGGQRRTASATRLNKHWIRTASLPHTPVCSCHPFQGLGS